MNLLTLLSLVTLGLGFPLNHTLPTTSPKIDKFQPKVFVVTMFLLEENHWLQNVYFANNFTLPGLSPLYPMVHCTTDFDVCHVTTGEGEINAANTMMALLLNPLFDFGETFWVINGIAGGHPQEISYGSVTIAKYAVQVALQYEMSYNDIMADHKNWTSGYWSYGSDDPLAYPENVYGTEVFELNEKLRDKALEVAKSVEDQFVEGSERNIELRKLYPSPANKKPFVKGCDVLTSDTYFSAKTLDDYFYNLTSVLTNGSATYCSTAQEDNASLEAFIRLAKSGVARYDRVIVMRSISDYAQPPSNFTDPVYWFNEYDQGGIQASLDNLFTASYAIVEDILNNWDNYTEIQADNYLGDIFGTLGGKMDFGKESYVIH